MTVFRIKTAAFAAVLAAATGMTAVLATPPAEAKGKKEYFVENYRFKNAHDGYSGFSGSYFCDYQKKPVYKCSYRGGQRVCKRDGWELRQHCY